MCFITSETGWILAERPRKDRPSARPLVLRALVGAAVAAALVASNPAQAFDFFRPMDRGGRIGDYMERIVAQAGQPYVIAGDCMSACTMWLGHRGTCVMPDAVLWFHGASDRSAELADGNPWRAISATGNATLLSMYPPRVRAVVRPWLASPDFHTLTGTQLAALGVPLCRATARAD